MRKFGTICMALGCIMILGAIALYSWNQAEDSRAGERAAQVVEQLMEHQATEAAGVQSTIADPYDPAMTEVVIDGNAYIGYLQLPNKEELLPVMTDWTYPKLQIAPCRFYGSTKTDNLVIMAHNYPKHFGDLKDLQPGETIQFLDMDNILWKYEVIATEVLNNQAVEEMTAGEFDLTLFTCTYGGESRLTLRCDRVLQ